MSETYVFHRDMGYSAEEFFRILPAAVRDNELSVNNREAVITTDQSDQQLRLTVTPLPDRVLANMRLPHVDVCFEFNNFSEHERKAFLQAFDRSYQRGGG
jgi:hypothetical protein